MASYAFIVDGYRKWKSQSLSSEERKAFRTQRQAIHCALADNDIKTAIRLVTTLHEWSNRSPLHHCYVHYLWGKIACKHRDFDTLSEQSWLAICAPFASIYRRVKA